MPDPAQPPEPAAAPASFEKACPQCWTRNRVRADYHDHACTTGQIPLCGACGADMFAYGPAFQLFFEQQQAKPPVEPWEPGDHLRVRRYLPNRAPYDHHGIYAGGGTVIEYDGPVRSGVVRETDLADFGRSGEPIERVASERRYEPAEVVSRARSRLGERSYSLVFQNCEHFAYWARGGKGKSEQVENHAIGLVVAPLYLAYRLWKGTGSDAAQAPGAGP